MSLLTDAHVAVDLYATDMQAQLDDVTAQLQAAKAALKPLPTAPFLREPYPLTGGPLGDMDQTRGRLLITKQDAVVKGWDIPGWIDIRAAGVEVDDVTVRGTTKYSPSALVYCLDAAAVETYVHDSTLVPDVPQINLDGVFGKSYTATRVETYFITDGFGIVGDDITIEECFVHDLVFWSPDPDHATDKPVSHSHGDGAQGHRGNNVTIRKNRIHAFQTVVFGDGWRTSLNKNAQGGYNVSWETIKNYRGQSNAGLMLANMDHVLIEDNEILGGMVAINVAPNSCPVGSITQRRNKFGLQAYQPILDPSGAIAK